MILQALTYMDGNHSVSEIQAGMDRAYGRRVIDVNKLIDICCDNGLLTGDEAPERSGDEFHVMLTNLVTVNLDRFQVMLSAAAHAFRPIISCMILIVVTACLLVLIGRVEVPWADLMTNPMTLPMVWGLQFLSILPHELAHAVVAKRYGLVPKSATLCVFYYLGLAVYVSTPGIYLQPPRHRLSIWLAGPFANISVASLFICFQAVVRGEVWSLFFAAGAFVNLGLAIGNMLPLLYSDGYYVVSTLLRVPNLRGEWVTKQRKMHEVRPAIKRVRRIYRLVVSGMFLVILIVQLVYTGLLGLNAISLGATVANLFRAYPNIFFAVMLGVCVRVIAWAKNKFGAGRHASIC